MKPHSLHRDLEELNSALARLLNEVDAAREIIVKLDSLCKRYGCPDDRDRLAWLDEQLHAASTSPPETALPVLSLAEVNA